MSRDRIETKRTSCKCGQGEFRFLTVEYDGWSWIDDKSQWYELRIECENCRKTLNRGNSVVNLNEPETLPDNFGE
jgi:hypothetical protein